MTARQMVLAFGEDKVSRKVKDLSTKTPLASFEVVHCVAPRKDYSPDKLDKANMPYESIYFVCKRFQHTQGIGFQSLPLHCPALSHDQQ